MRKTSGLLLLLLTLNGCALFAPAPEGPDKLALSPVSMTDLPGWSDDRVAEALPALRKSCDVLLRKSQQASMGSAGRVSDWHDACAALRDNPSMDEAATRAYLVRWFKAYEAHSPSGGLFTGYYEASLNGAWQRGGKYQTPLWKRPHDLLSADLGAFKPELSGKKIVGKAEGQSFVPYDDRAAVSSGALAGRAEALMWVDDPISAFFLEIQGSGRVTMADGSMMRIGYDAQNGHPFVPIGRQMIEAGAIEKPATMQKIRGWLASHPAKMQDMMNKNPSVVFFKKTEAPGAVGAQGVVLTSMRSMAVDPSFIALGTPLWVSMSDRASGGKPRLVVAQDTGGAIKGAVRGDMFCGTGVEAEAVAGNLQSRGTYYLLIPKNVSVRGE